MALRFQPDPQIFEGAALDYDQIAERLQTVSFFNPHLRIDLRGGAPPDQTSTTFHHPDGLVAYLRRLVAGQTLQGEPRLHTYVEGTTRVDLALQLLQHTEQRIALAVNSCPCPVGHPLERIVSDALCEAGVGQPMDTTANHLSTSGAGAVAVVNLWLLDAWSVWHSGNTTRDDSAPIRRAITAAIRNAFT